MPMATFTGLDALLLAEKGRRSVEILVAGVWRPTPVYKARKLDEHNFRLVVDARILAEDILRHPYVPQTSDGLAKLVLSEARKFDNAVGAALQSLALKIS